MILAVEYAQGVEDAWADIAQFVPKLVAFLLILVIGWIIARIIARIVDGILERVGFDGAIERGGVNRVMGHTKYDPSDVMGKLVFYTLFLFVLQAAFGVFGDNPISDLLEGIIAYLPRVFAAVLIIVVTAAIAAAVKEMIEAAIGGLSYGRGLAFAASAVILAVGVFAALSQLRIAPAIVNGLFYGLLAMVVGTVIVAVGGAGVTEMRPFVRRALESADRESGRIGEASRGASGRISERAEEAAGTGSGGAVRRDRS